MAVEGGEKLGGMKNGAVMGEATDESVLPEDEAVDIEHVITLRQQGSAEVQEMRA